MSEKALIFAEIAALKVINGDKRAGQDYRAGEDVDVLWSLWQAWQSDHSDEAWNVVRHWCYLGSVASLKQAQTLADTPASFDVDSYRILKRFLRYPEQYGLTVTPL